MINSLLKDSHIAQSYCHSNFENSSQKREKTRGQSATVNTSISTSANNCKPANVSFGGFFSPIKEFNFHKSTKVKAVLEKLDANPLLYESIFALGLTCFLRPASIMALPSEKKNKGDKVYAAAHSIASGIISFLITLAVVTPITTALKKVQDQIGAKEIEEAISKGLKKPEDLEKFKDENKVNKTFIKDAKSYLFNSNYSKAAGTYIKKVPEMFIAMPRATITIALIPVILKYVFGMEKKKKPQGDKTLNPILDNPAAINHNNMDKKVADVKKVDGSVNNQVKNQNVHFGSKQPSKFFKPFEKITEPIKKQYDKFTDLIASGIVKLLESKPIEAIVKKSGDNEHFMGNKSKDKTGYLYTHLTALTSVILSGFYMKKTLENKNLDEKKRRVLAINQGLVTGVSTATAYTLDIWLDKRYGEFTKKFEKINKGESKLAHYSSGLKMLKTAVIFGTIYRFIAPVFVTPIANHIGNKIEDKEVLKAKAKAKAAQAQNAQVAAA